MKTKRLAIPVVLIFGFVMLLPHAGAVVPPPRRRQTLQSTDKTLLNNDIGEDNTAISVNALLSNPSGNSNTAYGAFALSANTGTGNIALGIHAGGQFTTGNNNIDIGNLGNAGESNRIRIGGQGTQTSHIYSWYRWRDVAGPNGQLGVSASSQRFKKAVEPMDRASEAILARKPLECGEDNALYTHVWPDHPVIFNTAVAPSLPARNRSSALLASSKANVSVCVRTGMRGAISKNSSPSRRVRFATDVITRSSHKST